MSKDIDNIQYSRIINYEYAQWFQEVQYNGKTLSDSERREFVAIIDESIALYIDGLSITHDNLENNKDFHDEYYELERVVLSVVLFVLFTMIDCMVAGKHFILADSDYERRFMRGKMKVILNEGFKKLYGFDEKTHMKSEWDRLLPLMGHFPEEINHQYQDLTYLLEKHSKSTLWWREERNLETHMMDAEKLFASRQEEIIESKVMMDSMKLLGALQAVNSFLFNMHTCLFNYLVGKYRGGELKDE